MKTITIEQALKMGWCYDEERLRKIAGEKERWSALDILNLPGVPDNDKLFAVLRVELIDEPILHEFAAAIAAKRAWLKGEITDDELRAAGEAAWEAAVEATGEAAVYAARAAREAARAAGEAAREAEHQWQVDALKRMLEAEQ